MNIYDKYNKSKTELENRVKHIAGIYGGIVDKLDTVGACDWDDFVYEHTDRVKCEPLYDLLLVTFIHYVPYEDYEYDFTLDVPFSLLEATDEEIEEYYTRYVKERLSKHYEDKLREAIFTLREVNNLDVDVVMLAKEVRAGAKPMGVLLKEYAISWENDDD